MNIFEKLAKCTTGEEIKRMLKGVNFLVLPKQLFSEVIEECDCRFGLVGEYRDVCPKCEGTGFKPSPERDVEGKSDD